MVRIFEATKPKADEETPFSIGLMGPPGGGKTFSALRLATGIVAVRGGAIHLIDTENRGQKYRDSFDYKRVPFDPPFKPGDFLDAIRQQEKAGAGCIIIDSASDEHEGPGGVLDWQATELERLAGSDWAKRERMAQLAWQAPKRDRVLLLNAIARLKTPLILCFRAREKVKPIKDDRGKVVPTNIGWQPIAPSEVVSVMDLTCLLTPRADGVPTWKSDKSGEDFVIKLPQYLRPFIQEGLPLSEEMGRAFASWARGGAASGDTVLSPAAIEAVRVECEENAERGMVAFRPFWNGLNTAKRAAVGGNAQRDRWIAIANQADESFSTAEEHRLRGAA